MNPTLIHIIRKEFTSYAHNKVTLFTVMVIPMFALLLFNQVVSTDMNHISVMAVIEKPSDRANQFLEPIMQNDLFDFQGVVPTVEEGERYFKQNKIHALVVIDKDFDTTIDTPLSATTRGEHRTPVQIITDNSNTVIGSTANFYLQSALNPKHMDNISLRMLYNPGLYSAYQFGVNFLALFLILQSIIFCSTSMVKEKERHSIDAIIISPVSTWQLLLGKLITNLVLNCIVAVVSLTLMHYLVGVPIRGSLSVYALLTLICIITTMLLGAYISLSSATEANALNNAITVVCLPVLYFSGILFPTDSMPDWANSVSDLIYAKWYVKATQKVLLQGVDLTYVLNEIWYMLISMGLFLMLCIYKLKNDRWLR